LHPRRDWPCSQHCTRTNPQEGPLRLRSSTGEASHPL